MSTPLTGVPEDGDVVIRSGGPAEPSQVVRSIPGPDQFGCTTRAEALELARSYAGHAGVNVWSADGPNEFTLLARCRNSAGRAPQGAPAARPGLLT